MSWLAATVPTLVLSLLLPGRFILFIQLVGGSVAVLIGWMLLLASLVPKELNAEVKIYDETADPIPRKDLLNKKKYITLNTVEAIRGCNHACTFCAYPKAFGTKLYKRTIEDIIGEIKTLKGKIVVFPDVNLISDVRFAKELFEEMIPLKKWWFGLTTTAIGLDDELLDLFQKSGCKGLLIGFESVNQETQKNIHKGVNKVEEYQELMYKLHAHGIMVMGCFAFGGDEDKKDVFRRTVEMCTEAKVDLPRFSVITPFPCTQFYRELEKEDRITESEW